MEISTYRSILEDEEKRIKRWRRNLLTFSTLKWKFTTWGEIRTVLLHQWTTIILQGEPKVQQELSKWGSWGGRRCFQWLLVRYRQWPWIQVSPAQDTDNYQTFRSVDATDGRRNVKKSSYSYSSSANMRWALILQIPWNSSNWNSLSPGALTNSSVSMKLLTLWFDICEPIWHICNIL